MLFHKYNHYLLHHKVSTMNRFIKELRAIIIKLLASRHSSSFCKVFIISSSVVVSYAVFKSKKLDQNTILIGWVSFIDMPWLWFSIIPKTIFRVLSKLKPGKGGEIHITDAIQLLIHQKNTFIAHNFSGKYLDCGSMNGYINSSIEISKLWNYAW